MGRQVGVIGIQIGVTDDKKDNLKRAVHYIDKAMNEHPDAGLICLPELFYHFPQSKDELSKCEELHGEFLETFTDTAKKYSVNIVTGTLAERKGGSIYNTAICIDRAGSLKGTYSKTHLFDAFDKCESDTFEKGNEAGIFDLDIGRIGVAICYELRFPEYLRAICSGGAQMLLVPAAFYRPRAETWDILIRANALVCMRYMLAVNQYSDECFGHSALADPMGNIVSMADDRECYVYGVADFDYQDEVIRTVNTYKNRRSDLYKSM